MAEQKDSFTREVDEELRREQLLRLWEKYGTYVIAAVVLVVAGIGGYQYYQYRQVLAAQAAGAQFAAASKDMAQKRTAEARKALDDIAANGPSGYAALAKLQIAAADRAAGRTKEALEAYEQLTRQGGVDPLLADYARLQIAMLSLDSASWTEMQNRLTALTAESNAWRFSARELLGLAAMKSGRTQEARDEFQRLVGDRNVPVGVSERARLMMALLTEEQLSKGAAGEPDKAEQGKAPKEGAATGGKEATESGKSSK